MALAHPILNAEQRDAIAIDHFVDAPNDAEFALKVRERAPASLDNALRVRSLVQGCDQATFRAEVA